MSAVGSRKVYHDCHIFIDYSYYSVPFEYVGRVVDIDMSKELVRIFYQGREIAVHPRSAERGKFQTNVHHYPKYKRFSDTYANEKSLSYVEFLELLFEDETNNRINNSYKKRCAKAKLPAHKTLEDFDFSFQPSIDKRIMAHLLTEWVKI